MNFNQKVNQILAEARKLPIDAKRRVTAPDDKSHGAVNPYFNTPKSTMATSGFLGDRNNPKAFAAVFKLPKKIKKKR